MTKVASIQAGFIANTKALVANFKYDMEIL
ncbi:hypothetical protein QFZ37_002548 [Chryseobacterium ginsenosidimutans]|nr:hypothetical protein [Chryseobacterium ginsenosidimutans]